MQMTLAQGKLFPCRRKGALAFRVTVGRFGAAIYACYSSELQWKDVCVGVTRPEGRNKRRKNVTCLHYPCPLCSLQCQDLRGLLRNFPKQAKATIAAQVGNSDCSYQFIKTQFFVQAPELLVLQSQLVGDGYIKVVLASIDIFFPSLCFLVQQKYFFLLQNMKK